MHSYIILSSAQDKLCQAVLDDVIKSSVEIKLLKRRARKNPLAKIKLNRIINDILQMRFNHQNELKFK